MPAWVSASSTPWEKISPPRRSRLAFMFSGWTTSLSISSVSRASEHVLVGAGQPPALKLDETAGKVIGEKMIPAQLAST